MAKSDVKSKGENLMLKVGSQISMLMGGAKFDVKGGKSSMLKVGSIERWPKFHLENRWVKVPC